VGVEERVERRAVPPGEVPEKELFDRHSSSAVSSGIHAPARRAATMATAMRAVQLDFAKSCVSSPRAGTADSEDAVKRSAA
jgi:hypothetical protein